MATLEIFYGPMFSEKSGEMIAKAIKLSTYGGKKVLAFKPNIDTRTDMRIVSRTGMSLSAFVLDTNAKTLVKEYTEKESLGGVELKNTDIILFDEVQFYSEEIVSLIKALLKNGYSVMAAGLNLDYLGKPIGSVAELVLLADEAHKKTAFCSVCGKEASFTQRVVNNKPCLTATTDMVCIGDSESYEPRCREHFIQSSEETGNEISEILMAIVNEGNLDTTDAEALLHDTKNSAGYKWLAFVKENCSAETYQKFEKIFM